MPTEQKPRANEKHSRWKSATGNTTMTRMAELNVEGTTTRLLYKPENRLSKEGEEQFRSNVKAAREIVNATIATLADAVHSQDPTKLDPEVAKKIETHFKIDHDKITAKDLKDIYDVLEKQSLALYNPVIEAKISRDPSNSSRINPPHLSVDGSAKSASSVEQPENVTTFRMSTAMAADATRGAEAIIVLTGINKADLGVQKNNTLKIRHMVDGDPKFIEPAGAVGTADLVKDASAYASFSKDIHVLSKELSVSKDNTVETVNTPATPHTNEYFDGFQDGMKKAEEYYSEALPVYKETETNHVSNSKDDPASKGDPVSGGTPADEKHPYKEPDPVTKLVDNLHQGFEQMRENHENNAESHDEREEFTKAALEEFHDFIAHGDNAKLFSKDKVEEIKEQFNHLYDVAKNHPESFKAVVDDLVSTQRRPRERGFAL